MPDFGNVRERELKVENLCGDKGLLEDDVRVVEDWGGGPVSGKEGRED